MENQSSVSGVAKQAISVGGPYFDRQRPCRWCGCFYPDVVDAGKGYGFHCITHGWQYPKNPGPDELIPTEEWRVKERERLRSLHTGTQKPVSQ